MSYSQLLADHQRLVILQALQEDAAFSHNEAVLQGMLAAVGHAISIDLLRAHLAWLDEQGLITVQEAPVIGMVAQLTRCGEDVALGRGQIPGVARPRPA
jgi:hypothetical protein